MVAQTNPAKQQQWAPGKALLTTLGCCLFSSSRPSSPCPALSASQLHTHLERGPAAGAIAALQALEELGVSGLMGVYMEAQVLMGQEAGAADAAQEGSQKWFGRFVIIPVRRML